MLYKSFKKKIWVHRVDHLVDPWVDPWVDHFLGWPNGLTYFWVDRMGWPCFGVDRMGWPCFGLTVWVDLVLGWPLGWPFFRLTEWVDLFLGWPNGLTLFWVDRMGWRFFRLTPGLTHFLDQPARVGQPGQPLGQPTGLTTNTIILLSHGTYSCLYNIFTVFNFL